jgi:hypothetical protein
MQLLGVEMANSRSQISESKGAMPKKIKRLPLFVLAGAGLLAVAGVIAYLVIENRKPQGVIPVGAGVVPQSALMSVAMTTDPKAWQSLQEMGNADAQKLIADLKNQWQQEFLTNRGLDYVRDIQPWVGKQITMAELPINASTVSDKKLKPKVWILPIAKPELAQTIVPKLGGNTLEQRTYKGIAIRQTPVNATQSYALATLNPQTVVMATTPGALEQVIDTAQGQPSLLQLARYPQALAQIATSDIPFAQLYLNVPGSRAATADPEPAPGLSPSASPEASPTESPSPSPGGLALPNMAESPLQGFAANVSLDDQQIKLKSVSWLQGDRTEPVSVDNQSQRLAELLPVQTIAMYTGSNFAQFWQNYSQTNSTTGTGPLSPGQIRQNLKSATNLDFDQAFVPWMKGEFGVAVLPAATDPSKGSGLVLAVQTNDRGQAEQTFKQLDTIVQQRNQWLVDQSKAGNQTLTAWKVPPGLVVANHGWLDDRTIFLSMGSPIANSILPTPKDTLNRSRQFQNVMRSNLNPNNGQIYVDMRQSLNLIDNNPLLPKLSPELRRFAHVTQALGITSAATNNWSTRYDIAIELIPPQAPQ